MLDACCDNAGDELVFDMIAKSFPRKDFWRLESIKKYMISMFKSNIKVPCVDMKTAQKILAKFSTARNFFLSSDL